MWPNTIREKALVACGRRCCICHKFCGTKIELHHIVAESKGGASTLENCAPLCFDCHADVGHYNPQHPKGTKFSPAEVRRHRDEWFKVAGDLAAQSVRWAETVVIHEGQLITLRGTVLRETFPGPPNYESLDTDTAETYWMLAMPVSITVRMSAFDEFPPYDVPEVGVLHMLLKPEQYQAYGGIVSSTAAVTGRIYPCHTGHHRGDALLEVTAACRVDA
jgi:hypothetical protein